MAFDLDRQRKKHLEAASGYLELTMGEHALQELRQVRDAADDRFEFHRLRAEAYRCLQRWADALDDFRVCYELQPTEIDVLMGLAWCYKRIDRLSQAITTMQEAYRAHADQPVVLYNLACYYSLAGNKTQALSWLGRALRMQQRLRTLIPTESDFDPLRHDPDFRRLLELAEGSVAS